MLDVGAGELGDWPAVLVECGVLAETVDGLGVGVEGAPPHAVTMLTVSSDASNSD